MRRRGSILPLISLSVLGLVLLLHDPWWSAQSDISGPLTFTETRAAATTRYRLDAAQSKFIAHAHRGGLLWFKGHDHLVAARDFSGEAEITADAINPASLLLVVKSDSMAETNTVFNDQQKQIIDKELREIVLLPAQYPDITFKSTDVNGKAVSSNEYDLRIGGDLTLLGVTRHIEIPTHVSISGNDLHARGEFSINRSDFKVKATSAVHGLVSVRDKIDFNFDIVAHQN
jgi:polyisoprenoid-binding protein YceI